MTEVERGRGRASCGACDRCLDPGPPSERAEARGGPTAHCHGEVTHFGGSTWRGDTMAAHSPRAPRQRRQSSLHGQRRALVHPQGRTQPPKNHTKRTSEGGLTLPPPPSSFWRASSLPRPGGGAHHRAVPLWTTHQGSCRDAWDAPPRGTHRRMGRTAAWDAPLPRWAPRHRDSPPRRTATQGRDLRAGRATAHDLIPPVGRRPGPRPRGLGRGDCSGVCSVSHGG